MSHIVINCQIDISVVIFLIVEKRSVLEPSLSAMYQLQITDDEVCRDTGYIFRIKFLLKIIQYNGNSSLSCC